jgi:hypothetical protein
MQYDLIPFEDRKLSKLLTNKIQVSENADKDEVVPVLN